MFDTTWLARRSDPETSHRAAAQVPKFRETQNTRILAGIAKVLESGQRGATAAEIAEASGLTVVQVDRRMSELQARKLVTPWMLGEKVLVRGKYQCWGLV